MNSKSLADYEAVVGPVAIAQLRQLAGELSGATVVHVNSTREGGGVAEILGWLIPLMNDLGLNASWEVIEGNDDFFDVTKKFHNTLQGNPIPISQAGLAAYEGTVAENADRLRDKLEAADFVFIHDPQPAYLLKLCPCRHGRWIWRCHIDVSRPNRRTWKYVRGVVNDYDASIFSMPDFARRLDHPQFIIAPSIDPLSDKNCDLPTEEIQSTLDKLDMPSDVPLLTQVSRFDRFKDPLGVIAAFKMLEGLDDARLALAGGGASDDPEGVAVLEEVREAAGDDERIVIYELPPDAHRTINALQRASTVVVQKSLQEGFGLTVTEAMWKNKPVIGGNVGGIRLQVHNHYTGYLVDTPEGAALRMRELLRRPEQRQRIGNTAHDFVADNFLLTRHLREYLTLMVGLRRQLDGSLLAL